MKALVLVAAIATVPAGQGADNQVAGSWTAEFKGETFVRLEFHIDRGQLAGSMSIGDIQVDKAGDLERVGELPRDAKAIFEVTQQGSTVLFARKDGVDTDRFELRLLDSGRAELRFLLTEELRKELAADGIPVPKPIVLTRR